MKIKLCNVCLSIAYSLRGLELLYLNCMKVLYRVLLSSNMAEHLNKTNRRRAIQSINLKKKHKDLNQCKYIRCSEEKTWCSIILPINTITNLCSVLEKIYGKYSYGLKIRATKCLLLYLNLTMLLTWTTPSDALLRVNEMRALVPSSLRLSCNLSSPVPAPSST